MDASGDFLSSYKISGQYLKNKEVLKLLEPWELFSFFPCEWRDSVSESVSEGNDDL